MQVGRRNRSVFRHKAWPLDLPCDLANNRFPTYSFFDGSFLFPDFHSASCGCSCCARCRCSSSGSSVRGSSPGFGVLSLRRSLLARLAHGDSNRIVFCVFLRRRRLDLDRALFRGYIGVRCGGGRRRTPGQRCRRIGGETVQRFDVVNLDPQLTVFVPFFDLF
jgi:hypothetical protein